MTLYTNFHWALTGERQEMLVENGRVVARDTALDATADHISDLGGRWVMPAFVDAHCHILPAGLDLRKLPLGTAATHEEVLDLVRERHEEQPDGWLMAVHYDQNRYPGGHLDRHQLDKISDSRPILLRHVNGHASVANSAALRAANVDESTPNPGGGEFVRDADGRLTGVLLEDAHEIVTNAAPLPTLDEMVEAILLIGKHMRHLGIACASDMMTGRYDLRQELAAYRIAAERGCRIDTRLYLQWKEVFGPRGLPDGELRELAAALDGTRSRVAGIKIFADGAIGSATAAIYGRYSGESANGPVISRNAQEAKGPEGVEVSGQLIYRPERLTEMVRTAHDDGWAVAIHTIGDYATDLVMNAFEATGEPKRHRIEHGMLLSDSQIARMARLGCSLTFQPEFLMRFAHAYRRQLGEERASRLKRVRSVLDAGIPVSFNSDRPIVAGDPWDGILTAEYREGFDPSERCTRTEGVLAYTVAGSQVNGDGRLYGTLEPGSFAEFQVYNDNPMTSASPRSLSV
ncbi:amidohydrolase [Fimbriimonas ginsengisoli]|uniref:Amidohydrolase 3 n=1 Tax=Fimbriimonas ginsengisoli Gsoil 348 TaxID=661478 RepID=A0A068NP93_FIMGI|nr:amidohydrolase [Fimbriimonas ginsengisoli]AIE85266.1 Amidohydrolase 3 [Fimbriimonas ginsengisoli Gsoil 348]